MKRPIFILILLFSTLSYSQLSSVFKDTRDGRSYKSITIGNQTWMAENLNCEKFRNGDIIPEAKTNEEWVKAAENKSPAWCYYNNDPANGLKYGKLYNWYAINDLRGIAPIGWHVPKNSEWKSLAIYLGGDEIAGLKMKNTTGYKWDQNGNNTSGFSGFPGGMRIYHGAFYSIGSNGYWWCSDDQIITHRFLSYFSNNLFTGTINTDQSSNDRSKKEGLSIRCVKD